MRPMISVCATLLALLPTTACAMESPRESKALEESSDYAAARKQLVRTIDDYAEGIGERPDAKILASVGSIPRHLFVPSSQRAKAYDDHPLPIGHGQTIW